MTPGQVAGRGSAMLLLGLLFVPVAKAADEAENAEPVAEPQRFESTHRARFNGRDIRYTAMAGETYLRDKDGEPQASIFSFAYTQDEAPAGRPVTFVWNGGPGSASLWLHMGTYGPKRVVVPSDAAHPGAPPFDVVDAPETILDVTDLVFVDPVGTGFSRALGEHEDREYWGLTEDARSVAGFIRTWTTENGRWNAPRFLIGESFGTTRAASVAELLEGDFMMGLNGIVFVSQALDYLGSTPYVRDNYVANVTYLPTMAATAWYHGRIEPRPESLEALLDEARAFAVDELLPALFRGNALDAGARERIRDRLAYFTGLSPDYSQALRRNPGLRVLVASGYYDLVTPFFDAEYTLNRHDIDADRIEYRYYEGGHMMYVNEPSRTKLLEDTRAFIRRQLEP